MNSTNPLFHPLYLHDAGANLILHLNLRTDSAYYTFYRAFWDLAYADGGDDEWPTHINPIILAALLPDKAIEEYDNCHIDNQDELMEHWYHTQKQIILNL